MDIYSQHTQGLESPARSAASLTADGTEIVYVTRAVYVGTDGDLHVEMADGMAVTFRGLPAGTVLPIRIRRVLGAGTSATGILGLW